MATTFNWIYLGTSGTAVDPTEGNDVSENMSALTGTTWGSAGSPLYTRITSATMINNGGSASALDTNNSLANDQFSTNIGAGVQTFIFDGGGVYNVTITYTDGTTALVTGVVVQSTTGELFFAPEISSNSDTTAEEAKPIVSITLGTVSVNSGDFTSDRVVTGWDDGWVEGTAGADIINASYIEPIANGTDRIDNNDGIVASSMNDDRIRAGAGDDTVSAGLGNDLAYGGTGNDLLYGGAGIDTLYGEIGNDRLYGGDAADLLYGGTGLDTLYGDAGNDSLYGDVGNDLLYGGTEADLLYGGDDQDTLFGDAGQDTLYGDAGNDLLYGGDGADLLYGGEGRDILYGDEGSDTLFGGDGDDTLFGGLGNDSIEAGAGSDLVYGGDGDDTIRFGAGDATVYGGVGNDFIDDVALGNLDGFNLLYGGAGSDTIWAGNDADTVYGDEGNDVLNGEAGNDLLYGGADNDVLSGGADADTLYGDAGDDTLYGGIGNDLLYGGAGRDFIYGGDDRDHIYANGSDVVLGESVDGGGDNGITDQDTLTVDITSFGWARFDINYDPLNHENGTMIFYGPGPTFPVVGTIAFTEIEHVVIICFTPGTQILTGRGAVAVETLGPGDLVMTRDNGLQPLRWVGSRKLSYAELLARPEFQPVRIGAGALAGAGPDRSMLVSPQHRVLVEGARAEMYFGESEVLVPAKHLIGLAEITRALPAEGVTYIHILFDRHEIVQSDGIWTESFQPAERTLNALDESARAEVLELFPELASDATGFPAARLSLKAHEAKVLVSG